MITVLSVFAFLMAHEIIVHFIIDNVLHLMKYINHCFGSDTWCDILEGLLKDLKITNSRKVSFGFSV